MGRQAERVELGSPLPNGSCQSPQAEPDSALGGGAGVSFTYGNILVVMEEAKGLPKNLWEQTEEFCKYLQSVGRFKCL